MATPRSGMTLLEVTVAMAVFSIIMVVVLDCLSSMRRFTGSQSLRDDLTVDGQKLVKELVDHLANSAWFITPGTNLDSLASNAAYDTQARYYPYISAQDAARLPAGSPFAAHLRAVNQSPGAGTVDAQYWQALPAEHRLPSQELIFLKVMVGSAVADPIDLRADGVAFDTPAAPFTSYDNPAVLPRAGSLALRDLGGVISDLPLNWETWPNSNPWWEGVTPPANTPIPDPTRMREYTLVVVPDADTGKSKLELRYRNGPADPFRTLKVLSTLVDRIVADTYRTAPGLNVNQVRIVLYLSRFADNGDLLTRRVEATIALRSTVDPEYALRLADWLGGTGGRFALP